MNKTGRITYWVRNVSSHVSTEEVVSEWSAGIISDELSLIFQLVNFALLGEALAVLGTITNLINILVFWKQGFKESVNVSLFALSMSDVGMLGTLIWHNLCFNPLFRSLDLPFDPIEVQYLTAGCPRVAFTRITSCITAFIMLERCLCIAAPLKVKSIFTTKRVSWIMVSIFIALIASISPEYYANALAWKFVPGRNKTMLGLIYSADREQVEKISFSMNNIVLPFSAFLTILVCTLLLVVKLKSKAKWRKLTTSAGQWSNMSTRDQKVTKMVIMISTVFIVCFCPICVVFIGMTVEPELSITGKFHNMFLVVFSFGYLLESTNSSLNIFIYYRMSSKYRRVLRQIFSTRKS